MKSLNAKIQEYKEDFKSKVPKEVQIDMKEATKRLKDRHISQNALKSGDKIKNFILVNAVGKMVNLEKVLENKDYVVLNFYRGAWCPYCSLELRAFRDLNREFEDKNVQIIAISPQTPDNSLSTKEKEKLTYEVLSDVDNIVAKQFGLVFSLDESLKNIYKKFSIDIEGANNSHSFKIPMPATYLVDKNMKILYHFVDEDYTKRLEPTSILEKIKKI